MRKLGAVLAGLLLWGGLALAHSQEPSLGEIARKLRAAKKSKGEPTKVFTNDDLARLGRGAISVMGQAGEAAGAPGGEAAAGEQAATAGAAGQAAGEAPAGEQKDEKYWKGKFADIRAKIAGAEKELDLLQREWQLQRTQQSQDPNENMRQQYLGQQAGGKLAELQQQMREKQAEVERLKQQLADLENELRRAGGNPGWARP